VELAELVALVRTLLARPAGPDELRLLEAALLALDVSPLGLEAKLEKIPAEQEWVGLQLADAPFGHASLFLLPRGGGIPLHDHPGLTVLFRPVVGRVRVEAWDWLEPPPAPGESARARRLVDATLDPASPALWTRPDEGNVHGLTPVDGPAAFVDLFAPYYDDERCCSYYDVVAPDRLRRRPTGTEES
jgi:hypothetical protein